MLRCAGNSLSQAAVDQKCKFYESSGYTEIAQETWQEYIGYQENLDNQTVRLIKYDAADSD